MKITIENKKGLGKDIKVIVDKKTMDAHLEERYEEVRKNYTLKGFRPGKAPRDILKRQFGEVIMGEVLDKVLKDTTTKVLEEKKIRPATQPKIDLKKYGEGKELEYVKILNLMSTKLKLIRNTQKKELNKLQNHKIILKTQIKIINQLKVIW